MKIYVTALSIFVFVGPASEAKSASRRAPCDQICETDVQNVKICGNDGILYDSMCEFDRAKCLAELRGASLAVYSEGACISLNTSCDVFNDVNVKCSYLDEDLLCASNNVTYDSPCTFLREKCNQHYSQHLDVLHTGACTFDVSSALQINCSRYTIDTSGVAFENGTNVKLSFQCQNQPREYICLLSGRNYHGACHYCELLYRQGLVTPTYTTAYINHTGRCVHQPVVG